jgi:hypothetical protein
MRVEFRIGKLKYNPLASLASFFPLSLTLSYFLIWRVKLPNYSSALRNLSTPLPYAILFGVYLSWLDISYTRCYESDRHLSFVDLFSVCYSKSLVALSVTMNTL